jgi:hypothetical protein
MVWIESKLILAFYTLRHQLLLIKLALAVPPAKCGLERGTNEIWDKVKQSFYFVMKHVVKYVTSYTLK